MNSSSVIEQVIDSCIKKIQVDAKGLAEARERAAQFLTANALLANHLLWLDTEIGKHEAVVEMAYSQAIKASDGKNITEKKSHVIDDQLYREERIKFTELEARKTWVKTHMKIFENAHIMYRQLTRD